MECLLLWGYPVCRLVAFLRAAFPVGLRHFHLAEGVMHQDRCEKEPLSERNTHGLEYVMVDQIVIKAIFATQFFEGLAKLPQALKVNLHTDSFEGRGLIQKPCKRTGMGKAFCCKAFEQDHA